MSDINLDHNTLTAEETGLTEGGSYSVFSKKKGGLVLVEAEVASGEYEEVLKKYFLNDVILILPGTKLRFTLMGPNPGPAAIRLTEKS